MGAAASHEIPSDLLNLALSAKRQDIYIPAEHWTAFVKYSLDCLSSQIIANIKNYAFKPSELCPGYQKWSLNKRESPRYSPLQSSNVFITYICSNQLPNIWALLLPTL